MEKLPHLPPMIVEAIINNQGKRRNQHRGWMRPKNQRNNKRRRNKERRQAIKRQRMN